MFNFLKKLFGKKEIDSLKQFEKTSYYHTKDKPKVKMFCKELTPEQRHKRRREEIAKATRHYQLEMGVYRI